MGGWVEGDPAGDRRFLDLPGPFRPERGGILPGVRVAYETWGTLDEDGGNAVLVEHALTGDSHVVGPPGPGHPTGGLVGRADRPGPARWTPTGSSSSAPTCWAAARGRRALVAGPGRRPVGFPLPRGDRRRPGARSRRRWPTPSGSAAGPASSAARWAACGRWSGPSPCPTGSRRCSSWPRAPSPPPTRSAPRPRSRRRSAPTRAGPAATTRSPIRRSTASASPAGSRT